MEVGTAIDIVKKSGVEIIDSCGRLIEDLPFEFGRYRIGDVKDPVIIVEELTCKGVEQKYRGVDELVITYQDKQLVDIIFLLFKRSSCRLGYFYGQPMCRKCLTQPHYSGKTGPCFQYPLVHTMPEGIKFHLKMGRDRKVRTVLENGPDLEPNVDNLGTIFGKYTILQEVHFTPYLELQRDGFLLELILELEKVVFDADAT